MPTSRCLLVFTLALAACMPDGEDSSVDVRVAAAELVDPRDATPDPSGTAIYFIADDAGNPAVLRARDGDITTIAAGLGPARSLAIAATGATLIVADGGLERIDLEGTRTRVDAAEDHDVRGVDLVRDGGADVVYFTGVDPAAGDPAIFRVPLAGGAVEIAATGFAADADLDAVVRAADGTLYASDLTGRIWRAGRGSAPEAVLMDIRLGDPAGVALTADDRTLLISSLSDAGTSQVILLDTETLATSIFDGTIGDNRASGGVHRAEEGDVFAWSGVSKTGEGLVYRIEL